MVTQQKTDWHRLQNLIFTDFFTGSAWSVELEKDLSMKKAVAGHVEFAARQYRGKTQEISTVLNTLFDNYNLEGIPVSYTMKDFQKDYVKNYLGLLSPDEILR